MQPSQLSISPTFTSLQLPLCTPSLHLLSPLVLSTSTHLYLQRSPSNNQLISTPFTNTIINCTYSQNYEVLMLLCDDWHLYVFNKNLESIAKLGGWESKYSVGFQWVESMDALLLIGVGQIELLKVKINTNIKTTKFLSSIKFSIQRKQLLKADHKLKWNKGYGYSLEDNLLYVWSLQDINFYQLKTLKLRSCITSLTAKSQSITSLSFYSPLRYTLTGLINGNMKVWRLPLLPTSSNEHIMLHNCILHGKAVQSIVDGGRGTVISSSADLTIGVWGMEGFELLRRFSFAGQYERMWLVRKGMAYAIKSGRFGELVFGKDMDFICEVSSDIISFSKSINYKENHTINQQSPIGSLQITLSSNLSFQLSAPLMQVTHDLTKCPPINFYPPLKAKAILQVQVCPVEGWQDKYFMLVQSGQLYRVRLQGQQAKIQEVYHIEKVLDIEKHPIGQSPSLLKFFPINPIDFDSQITQNSLNKPKQTKQIHSSSLNPPFLTMGLSHGSIIMLAIPDLSHLSTRLTYHRDRIIALQSVKSCDGFVLVSMCVEGWIKLTRILPDGAICFMTLSANGATILKAVKDKLAIVLPRGVLEIADFEKSWQNPIVYEHFQSQPHQKQILSIDVSPLRQFLLTSSLDNNIKIWTLHKLLLHTIHLDAGLNHAIWSSDKEIVVSHAGKLLLIRDVGPISDEEVNTIEEEWLNGGKWRQISFKAMLDKHKGRKKESLHDYMDKQEIKGIGKVSFNPQQYEIVIKTGHRVNKSSLSTVNKSSLSTVHKTSNTPMSIQQVSSSRSNKKSKHAPPQGRFSVLSSHSNSFTAPTTQSQNLKATAKHIQQLNAIRKLTNQPILPMIQPRKSDKFDQFITDKLGGKKMLTRRDITLNRIIMKNLIREQMGGKEDSGLNSIKLDY